MNAVARMLNGVALAFRSVTALLWLIVGLFIAWLVAVPAFKGMWEVVTR